MMEEELRRELSEIQAAIASLREQMRAAYDRIDELKELVSSVHDLALTMKGMLHEQELARRDIDEMKSKSARRWETVVLEVLKMAVAVAAGAVLMKLGLK